MGNIIALLLLIAGAVCLLLSSRRSRLVSQSAQDAATTASQRIDALVAAAAATAKSLTGEDPPSALLAATVEAMLACPAQARVIEQAMHVGGRPVWHSDSQPTALEEALRLAIVLRNPPHPAAVETAGQIAEVALATLHTLDELPDKPSQRRPLFDALKAFCEHVKVEFGSRAFLWTEGTDQFDDDRHRLLDLANDRPTAPYVGRVYSLPLVDGNGNVSRPAIVSGSDGPLDVVAGASSPIPVKLSARPSLAAVGAALMMVGLVLMSWVVWRTAGIASRNAQLIKDSDTAKLQLANATRELARETGARLRAEEMLSIVRREFGEGANWESGVGPESMLAGVAGLLDPSASLPNGQLQNKMRQVARAAALFANMLHATFPDEPASLTADQSTSRGDTGIRELVFQQLEAVITRGREPTPCRTVELASGELATEPAKALARLLVGQRSTGAAWVVRVEPGADDTKSRLSIMAPMVLEAAGDLLKTLDEIDDKNELFQGEANEALALKQQMSEKIRKVVRDRAEVALGPMRLASLKLGADRLKYESDLISE
jgi:hypothetical protein